MSIRTQALEISSDTRRKVIERQDGYSITGRWLKDFNIHHFVSRGCGGVGYEWNLVALSPEEHRQYHDGGNVGRYTHEQFTTLMRNHLVIRYKGWTMDKCKYKKGYEEADYGIERFDK